MEYNIYCDESCYFQHDGSDYMTIGAVWCEKNLSKKANKEIALLKEQHGYSKYMEIKWTKISNSNISFYKDLINYFFDNHDLCFRCYIADKSQLDHKKFNQTHDDWYYKIYFRMLEYIYNRRDKFYTYLDIKDTHSNEKCKKLHEFSCNNIRDFNKTNIKSIQPIRSNEVQLIQLTDVLIGAICHYNRFKNKSDSKAKREVIELIKQRSNSNLLSNSYLVNIKFNLFFWSSRNG